MIRSSKAIKEILISEQEIKIKVKELGERLTLDYKGKDPVFISILKGSIVFLADLIRSIDLFCSVDFIAVSSYAGETETSGIVKLIMDLRESINDRHVVLVEDIVDTGLTMNYLKENLLTRRPASFRICSFLSKPHNRYKDIDVDYVGFEIPNKFVVGYGMDYKERFRNLPYIAVVDPEIIKKELQEEV